MTIRLRSLFAALALWSFAPALLAEGPYQQVQPLLMTSKTILDEPMLLPNGQPFKVTSTIVVINPGEETAWHKHGVPLYAYILSGSVTVDYGDRGERRFEAGSAFMEAMDHWHRGTNRGSEPVRILAVYLGVSDAPAVITQP